MVEFAVETQSLTKKYGDFLALDQVTFSVRSGEIFGLLGPNGAGKTTTIKILTTLVRPTSGKATVAGYDVVRKPREVKRRIGWVAAEVILDDDLTAMENLSLQASLQGMNNWRETALSLLDYFGIREQANLKVGKFSTGMRKKLEIVMALLNSPEVIFMDEPTIGLDVSTRQMLWKLIEDVNSEYGVTVLLTTHYMEEADALCHRIGIINRGKIVAIGSPEELKSKVGGMVLEVTAPQGIDLSGLKFPHETKGDRVLVNLPDDSGSVVEAIQSLDLKRVKGIRIIKPSLDSVFLKLTGNTLEEAESTDYRKFYAMIRRATR